VAELAQGRVARDLQQLISLRQSHAVFGSSQTEILETYNPHAFAFARVGESGRLLVIANFSEQPVSIPGTITDILASSKMVDLLSGRSVVRDEPIALAPYDIVWIHA